MLSCRNLIHIVGIVLILVGSGGIGLWYRNQFIGRHNAKKNMIKLLELFVGEIRYGKATLPECCSQISKRLDSPWREGLNQVSICMQNNPELPFSEQFVDKMEECMKKLPLKKEDKDLFFRPFTEQGFWDGKMQIKSFEHGIDALRSSLQTDAKQLRDKCKLATGLSLMGGLFLVVILL